MLWDADSSPPRARSASLLSLSLFLFSLSLSLLFSLSLSLAVSVLFGLIAWVSPLLPALFDRSRLVSLLVCLSPWAPLDFPLLSFLLLPQNIFFADILHLERTLARRGWAVERQGVVPGRGAAQRGREGPIYSLLPFSLCLRCLIRGVPLSVSRPSLSVRLSLSVSLSLSLSPLYFA